MPSLKTLVKGCGAILLTLQLTSCATIINGTTQRIPVDSNPQGATVCVNGNVEGCTPTTIEVKRKRDHLLTLSKEGYQTESFQLQHVLSGAVAGNLVAGGFIGWGVDACSGGQYRIVPETVYVDMKPCYPPYCPQNSYPQNNYQFQ